MSNNETDLIIVVYEKKRYAVQAYITQSSLPETSYEFRGYINVYREAKDAAGRDYWMYVQQAEKDYMLALSLALILHCGVKKIEL